MNLSFIKSLPFALSMTCAIVQGYSQSDVNVRISRLETDMNKIRSQTAFGNLGAKTASGFPQIDGYGVFVKGDFLFWKLYEFQTDFAFNTRDGSTLFKGNVHSMKFDWESGFRLGMGYIFDYEGWDLYLNFTDYKTHANKRIETHSGGKLYEMWGIVTTGSDSIEAKWHVQFEELDLLLGRNYFISKYVSLHPHFGLTSAWIHQKRTLQSALDLDTTGKLKEKNNCWGIGPRLGLDTQFFLGRNFSLYANGSGTLLWGDFKIRGKQTSTSNGLTDSLYDDNLNTHKMVPAAGLSLGVAYETNFNHNCNHFLIKLGYEAQYFWRQNQFPIYHAETFSFSRASDDLAMQGLTIDLRLDF